MDDAKAGTAAAGGDAPGVEEKPGHFIPFRKADIVEMCLADGALAEADRKGFGEFCEILQALFHFEYHKRMETLKDGYAPFNPDADTRRIASSEGIDRRASERRFMAMLDEVLTGANFTKMTRDAIEGGLDMETRFKVLLKVDLDDFEELSIYRRARRRKTETVKSLFGLRTREVEVVYHERVVVYLRFKDAEHFEKKGRKDLAFRPGESYLKLFQNVPEEDMEMLFPNAEMQMRLVDKLLLGVPAAAGGVAALAKLLAPLLVIAGMIALWLGLGGEPATHVTQKEWVALAVGLVALGGFAFRQVNKVKGRRLKYLKSLSENLYFRVLDNNAGVIHHLVDAAEEEDCKEAILAYYFLLTRKGDLTEPELDGEVERWFAEKHGVTLDFEVDDAMAKLERLELAHREGEVLRVEPLDEAKRRIDSRWDNLFEYNS